MTPPDTTSPAIPTNSFARTLEAPGAIWEEGLLSQEFVLNLSQDEKVLRLNAYRQYCRDGGKLSDEAYQNSIRLLRAVRHRAIQTNSHATKKAKAKAEVAPLDLSSF